ncbi:MAG: DUF4333 domain-containing protein [Candidatus Nanopelagicales bacterium]
MRSSLIALGAGALLATALAGCSGSVSVGGSNLDIDKLETTVATEMQTQLNLSGTPTVTCPDPVPIEQGNVFTCTAELDGDSVDVEVTQTDDQGNVTWQTVDAGTQ